ncbi:MAG TPA: COX15/CtaA family protein [Thermoanaerobaculia bacterium]
MRTERALHRLALALVLATVGLIFAGGLVTSTESGLSVPDWPTTYGQNPFTFPVSKWVGGIKFEHSHRLIASAVGLLTVVVAVAFARGEKRAWVRRLAYLALAAVVAQGVLGGLTVLFLLPTAISVAHACLAQTFFCLAVALAVVTSPRWREAEPAGANSVRRMAAATVAVVFLQLLVGAVMRHTKAGLAIPDFPLAFGRVVPPITSFAVAIHFAHRMTALAVAAAAAVCLVRARRSGREDLKRIACALGGLVGVQIALGALTVLSKKDVILTTAHVVTGALVLGASLVLALASRRTSMSASRKTASRTPAAAISLSEEPAWK